ncbi:sensor histidine kinase [Streptomyces orinoci]|uniref:histidine kinase n=1 Tax=Streptomyces orinoci TaxID=67339 RepID=A0ABV3K159_STRON|nr:HAMP domain-containing sensor histidine kinase [Streptomyces orinoci]
MKRPVIAARTRIAVAFGAIFLVLGTALLVTVNVLSREGTEERAAVIARTALPVQEAVRGGALSRTEVYRVSGDVSAAASRELTVWSAGALLATALLAVGVGWWTAGRFLSPVQGALDSQRRFIANASHELRTPLATQRAAIQVGLEGEPSAEELARTKALLLAANRKSERLIDGLLVLANSERGLEKRELTDLAEVVTEEVAAVAGRAAREGVRIAVRTVPAPVSGNRVLLAQLAGNLLRNGVSYNRPGGSVQVAVEPGRLTVVNTGPEVPAAEVPALFEPFRRGEGRDRLGGGAGLGLSIVRSIARAHGGTVKAAPNAAGGGLRVTVELPRGGASGRSRPRGPR